MSSKETLTILEALENLNILADAETLHEIEVSDNAQLISHKEEEEGRDIYWLDASRDDQTIDAIKVTYRTVLHYLQTSYRKMKNTSEREHLIEGINTIMVLVGEATRKIDKFGALFKQKVSDLEEYKEIQSFYREKVVHESTGPSHKAATKEEKEWEETINLLEAPEEVQEIEGVHFLNDIETVKKDHLYELFFLKNESGHRFYTFQLARNMKLACEFGQDTEKFIGDDPLLQVKNWEDKSLQILAKEILTSSQRELKKFYKEALKYKDMDLVATVNNAIMALMLASNPRNLLRQLSYKGCYRYFSDFLFFLRQALFNREFQKLQQASVSTLPFLDNVLGLIQALIYQLYLKGSDQQEITRVLKGLLSQDTHKKEALSERFKRAHHLLDEILKKHPNGPLFKAFDFVMEEEKEETEEEVRLFDPLHQGNIPTHDADIVFGEHVIHLIRIPCPTIQEFIHKAGVIEEYKIYLKSCLHIHKDKRQLIINFQDRTSWKEHARSLALEELGKQAEYAEILTVVTLAKDTDFYNQTGVYQDLDNASEFIDQFKHHVEEETTGYCFPLKVKSAIFPTFVSTLLESIHKAFFEDKKTLSIGERLDFIELSYPFLCLKLIEITRPDVLSLLSKDSFDISGTAEVELLLTAEKRHGKGWQEEEIDRLMALLFGQTLIHRERNIHPERFERLLHLIKRIESHSEAFSKLKGLFSPEMLQAEIRSLAGVKQ